MSEILDLIDEHKRRHGNPSDASIARAIGIAPQTISSWRNRGIKDLPDPTTLRHLADFLHVDYFDVVLVAALRDIGYWDGDEGGPAAGAGA